MNGNKNKIAKEKTNVKWRFKDREAERDGEKACGGEKE